MNSSSKITDNFTLSFFLDDSSRSIVRNALRKEEVKVPIFLSHSLSRICIQVKSRMISSESRLNIHRIFTELFTMVSWFLYYATRKISKRSGNLNLRCNKKCYKFFFYKQFEKFSYCCLCFHIVWNIFKMFPVISFFFRCMKGETD